MILLKPATPFTEEKGKKRALQRLQLWLYIQLWMKLLQPVTNKGVPINNIMFVKPPVTLCSDAFEYGIAQDDGELL